MIKYVIKGSPHYSTHEKENFYPLLLPFYIIFLFASVSFGG